MKTNPTGMKVVAYINAEAVDIAARHGDAYHIGKTPDAVMLPLVTLADAEAFMADAIRYRLIRRKVCILSGDLCGEFRIINLYPTYVGPDAAIELDAAIDADLSKLGEKGNG